MTLLLNLQALEIASDRLGALVALNLERALEKSFGDCYQVSERRRRLRFRDRYRAFPNAKQKVFEMSTKSACKNEWKNDVFYIEKNPDIQIQKGFIK